MSFENVSTYTVNGVPFPQHYAFAAIDSVPAGAAWQATVGSVPYNDVAAGYGGFQDGVGDSVTYDPVTHKFTVTKRGRYQILAIQNINVGNSLGAVLSDGRLRLLNSSGARVGVDTDRIQTTAGMATAGVLSYDLSMLSVVLLTPDTYTIDATAENGGPGLLLGKGSVSFTRIA